MLYTISYDFSGDDNERKSLEDAINSCGAAIRSLESTWLLLSDLTASQIRISIENSVSSSLYCLITEVTGKNNAWSLEISRGVKAWRTANNVEMC